MGRVTAFWYAEIAAPDPSRLLSSHPTIATLWEALKSEAAAEELAGYPSLPEVVADPTEGGTALATEDEDGSGGMVMALWYAQSLVLCVRREVTGHLGEFNARLDALIPEPLRDITVTAAGRMAVTDTAGDDEPPLDRFHISGVGEAAVLAIARDRYAVHFTHDQSATAIGIVDDLLWYDTARSALGHGALFVLDLASVVRTRASVTQAGAELSGDLVRLEAEVSTFQARLAAGAHGHTLAAHRESGRRLLSIVERRTRLLTELSELRLKLHDCQQLRDNLGVRLAHLGHPAPATAWSVRLAQVVEREIGFQVSEFELADARLAAAVDSYQVVLDQQNYSAEQRRQVLSAAQAAAFTVLALMLTLLQTVQSDSQQVTLRLVDLGLLLATIGTAGFATVFLILDRGVGYDRRHRTAIFCTLICVVSGALRLVLGQTEQGTAVTAALAAAPLLWWPAGWICRGLDLLGPAAAAHPVVLRTALVTAGAAGAGSLGWWTTGNWLSGVAYFLCFATGGMIWAGRRGTARSRRPPGVGA
ncbi:hypothetical protein [Streptomyces sp. NPDC056468]|uniref:hypothetical protein n=1 Tax=Streptomyces sp. NPDC056468 TaxID=3345830 RepID=UPI0036777A1C